MLIWFLNVQNYCLFVETTIFSESISESKKYKYFYDKKEPHF